MLVALEFNSDSQEMKKQPPRTQDHYLDRHPVTKQILETTIHKLQKLAILLDLDYDDQKEVKEIEDLISYLIYAQIQITIKGHLANNLKEKERRDKQQ